MSEDKQRVQADQLAGVDLVSTGVPTDSPEADPENSAARKGVRHDSTGRELFPWEVDPKDQLGPAGDDQPSKSAKNKRN